MDLVHELIARNRAGEPIGLPCFCTANEHVLRALLTSAAKTGFPTIIEATCNQVNQEGGYTGMTPQNFMTWVKGMANDAGVPIDQLMFGGDHLGPYAWKSEPLDQAMEKARELIKLYVQAGFTKIHLDTSMACGGEPNPSFAQIAERSANLCAVAEANAPDPSKLIYIIGTEVPIPGGEIEEPSALDVTSVARLHNTIQTHRDAWFSKGLDDAWSRIVSVVTQPGVDFSHSTIYPFIPQKALPLRDAIRAQDGLTYEAHSTDYQSNEALADLVKNHFFFLKVGPELTFRLREAIFALAAVEDQLQVDEPSFVRDTLVGEMIQKPDHWQDYYSGTTQELCILRIFSYSDRIRYYWTKEKVAASLSKLISNLRSIKLPETVISQSFMALNLSNIPTEPSELIALQVGRCIDRYFAAAGH